MSRGLLWIESYGHHGLDRHTSRTKDTKREQRRQRWLTFQKSFNDGVDIDFRNVTHSGYIYNGEGGRGRKACVKKQEVEMVR